MDYFKEIIIFRIPQTVPEAEVHTAVRALLNPPETILSSVPLKHLSTEYDLRVSLSSSAAAFRLAKAESITIGANTYGIDIYKDKAIVEKLVPKSKIIEGFVGTEEELKAQLQPFSVRDVKQNPNDKSCLVILQTDDAAAALPSRIAELNNDNLKVKPVDYDVFTSFISPTSNNVPRLQASPKNIVLKGQALAYLTEEDIKRLCKDPNVAVTFRPKAPHPIAFVSFSTEEGAKAAVESLNNNPIPVEILPREGSSPEDKMKSTVIVAEYVKDNHPSAKPKSVPVEPKQPGETVSQELRETTLWITHNTEGETDKTVSNCILHHAKVQVRSCSVRYRQNTRPHQRPQWSAIVTVDTAENAQKIINAFNNPSTPLPLTAQFRVQLYNPNSSKLSQDNQTAYVSLPPPLPLPPYGGYPPIPSPEFLPPQFYPPGPPVGPPNMRPRNPRPNKIQGGRPFRRPPPEGTQPLLANPNPRPYGPTQPNSFLYQPGMPAMPSRQPLPPQPLPNQPVPPQPLPTVPPTIPQPAQPVAPQPVVPGLDVAALQAKSEEDRREEIGEYIYNRAKELKDENVAPRIAGMLLEFQFEQLEPLLRDRNLLDRNIEEAFKVISSD